MIARGRSTAKYVALLRAINVGGHSIIKMADLRVLLESFGLTNVTTYIQTGNIVFMTPETDRERLAASLQKRLESAYRYPARVFLLTPAELRSAASQNPFEPERDGEAQQRHLMFLARPPAPENVRRLMALERDEYRFQVRGAVLYYAYPRSAAGSRRTIDFEKVLGTAGTARTARVVDKLVELAQRD